MTEHFAGNGVAINLNNHLCQMDELESWQGTKPTWSGREIRRRGKKEVWGFVSFLLHLTLPPVLIYSLMEGLFDLITGPLTQRLEG